MKKTAAKVKTLATLSDKTTKTAKKFRRPGDPHPKYKKDGTAYVPWEEQALARLKKKEAMAAAGIPEDRTGKCQAMTTGTWGPKRPCDRWAMKGMTVCQIHGGDAKHTREAARKRLLAELDPTIDALLEVRDQNDHMPSKLGASVQIINRILGKPADKDKERQSKGPVINIGQLIAGIPANRILPQPSIEGELLDGSDDTDDSDD